MATMRIINLHVAIDATTIVRDLNLTIAPGSIHALMGPNGSGKSTLAYAIAGHPRYAVTAGTIMYDDQAIQTYTPDKRAKLGILLAFQHPPALPGVRVLTFLKEVHHAMTGTLLSVKDFQNLLIKRMEQLHIDPAFMHRNLNEGFSGGEKKQCEMLQLLLLQPKVIILDEIDSGLDIDALKMVAQALHMMRQENPNLSIVMITHYQRIVQYVQPSYVHIMCSGSIVASGDASLVPDLEARGYDAYRAGEMHVNS